MISASKEDWAELIQALRDVEKNIASWNDGGQTSEKIENCRRSLLTFHTSAAMLNLPDLERIGKAMERYLLDQVKSLSNPESVTILGFAADLLIDSMHKAMQEKEISSVNVEEVMDILSEASSGLVGEKARKEVTPEDRQSESQSDEEKIEAILGSGPDADDPELSELKQTAQKLGGELIFNQEDRPGTFQLHFSAMTLEQVKNLLSSFNPEQMFAPLLPQKDVYVEEVLNVIKEFMLTLTKGDISHAQDILLLLAEQKHQAGIFDEIGAIARDLHNSLKNFMDTIDSALREMVEDRIPDSGNRLEHILQLTERAANTTLTHVEAMQSRNREESDNISRLRENLLKLNAIGEQARERLKESRDTLENLNASIKKNHDDLITVLTAQDYQDLTGQIILKIIKILKDLELKLVNVIRTFGMKVEKHKKKISQQQEKDELYGPAYKGKEGALHSQDDVDDLLAEFGF